MESRRTSRDGEGLGSSSTEWVDSEGAPWAIRFEWAKVQGKAEVVGLTVRGPRRVDARVLRELPIGRLINEDRASRRAFLRRAAQARVFVNSDEPSVEDKRALKNLQRRAAAQVGPYTDVELAKTADAYRAGIGSGRPVQAVMDECNLSLGGARHRIARARAAGLLGPAPGPGRAGE